jgi:hypothetical protein
MQRGNPENLRLAARSRSEDTTRRAEQAIKTMIRNGDRISFRGVARQAGCSDDFLYRHPELRARIEQLRTQPSKKMAAGSIANAPSAVVRELTAQLKEVRRSHYREVTELRAALAQAHSELLELRRQLATNGGNAPRAARSRREAENREAEVSM